MGTRYQVLIDESEGSVVTPSLLIHFSAGLTALFVRTQCRGWMQPRAYPFPFHFLFQCRCIYTGRVISASTCACHLTCFCHSFLHHVCPCLVSDRPLHFASSLFVQSSETYVRRTRHPYI